MVSKKLINKKSKKLINKKSKKLVSKKSKKLVSKKSKKTSRGGEEDINEVLKGIAKNINIEYNKYKPTEAEIKYEKGDIKIRAIAQFQKEDRGHLKDKDGTLYKNDHIKFYLQLIDIKNLTGYGLCPVIIIFMLRKLYNKAVENYSNNKYIYTAETKNSSKQHDYAKSCYIKAFNSLGFKLTEEIIGKETINADIYYFRKENNNKDWEKIEEDLYYTNSRSKIKYTIGTDEIKMEKI